MKLSINSKDFIVNFINPILEINKTGKAPIFVEDDQIYSITSYENSIYLYTKYKPVEIVDKIDRFNINLERLKRILAYTTAEKQFCEFNIHGNNCSYKDDFISANIKLIENNLVSIPKFNMETFKNFPFVSEFAVTKDVMLNLKRGLEFSTDTSKFYLRNEKGDIYFLFGDEQTKHTDDIKIFVTKDVKGNANIKNFIYDTNILKLISKTLDGIEIKIAENGTFLIKITQANSELNYITTQLKK